MVAWLHCRNRRNSGDGVRNLIGDAEMTQNDIGRLLAKLGVKRSKTVEVTYPKGCIVVHVPGAYLATVTDVCKRMTAVGQDLRVTLLDSGEVRDGEHVWIKMKGYERSYCESSEVLGVKMPPDFVRRVNAADQRRKNRNVVITLQTVTQ